MNSISSYKIICSRSHCIGGGNGPSYDSSSDIGGCTNSVCCGVNGRSSCNRNRSNSKYIKRSSASISGMRHPESNYPKDSDVIQLL